MRTLTEVRFFKWQEDEISVNLRSKSGSYGGGSEVLVIENWNGEDVCGTLSAHNANGSQRMPDKEHFNAVIETGDEKYIARRLSPEECELLNGFPQGWTDIGEWTDSKGKKHKTCDAQRYMALGNSIGIPAWLHVMYGISEELKASGVEKPTLGSLFDGIGGFPRIWEHYNGKGSAVWASEIEEFCIAVTKVRFPEDE